MDKFLKKRPLEESEEPEAKKRKTVAPFVPKKPSDIPSIPKASEKPIEDGKPDSTESSSSSVAKPSSGYNKIEDYLTETSWRDAIEKEFKKESFKSLKKFLQGEQKAGTIIHPKIEDTFAAFNLCPLDEVKVVILGQDPYQTAGFAHGLSFSVQPGVVVPKSLQNIYKELSTDIKGFKAPKHGNLTSWAEQGVLLLNTILTVEDTKANSHKKKGWENFTDEVIKLLNKKKNLVFMLWGGPAKAKLKMITESKHCVLQTTHPSPLGANQGGWFDMKIFSKCNKYLEEHELTPIDWCSVMKGSN
ncbi:uracil-DNA glycosylase [Acrasis kona]|uniref:Uracil-DNA glycosylase n=1 Tax=Acrasis kona TaxID=1008807 RepID=A0AAW2Z925_9EUKA